MRGTRLLLLSTALWSAVGIVGAVSAPATGISRCQSLKGTLRVSPGLTDVPTNQTVTLAARMNGCPSAGGSGFFVATASLSQTTCATLTAGLPPTTATFAWADHTVSTASLTFASVPGSANQLDLHGRVVSGAERGDRISGGMHLRATFSQIVRQARHRQHVAPTRHLEQRPLNSKGGGCTSAAPVTTINVASSQSLQLIAPRPDSVKARPAHPRTRRTGTWAHATTTGSSLKTRPSIKTTASALSTDRARARQAALRRAAHRRAAFAIGTTPPSGSGSIPLLEPGSVLFAGFLATSTGLFILLLKPAWLIKLLKGSSRLHR